MDFNSMMNQPPSHSREAANRAFSESLDQLQEIWKRSEASIDDWVLHSLDADLGVDFQALEEAGEDLEQFFNQRED